MPLKVVCQRCRAALVLHDAFAGATCRCKHCGCAMDVPAPARAVAQPTTRPTRPRLLSEAAAARVQRAAPGIAAATVVGAAGAAVVVAKPKLAIAATIFSKWWIAVSAGAIVTAASVGTVGLVRKLDATKRAATQLVLTEAGDELLETTAESRDAIYIARWPAPPKAIQTYLSQDMSDGSIAWVIDTSKNVAPYYGTLTRLTSVAMLHLQSGSQRFGVVLATSEGPRVRQIEFASKSAYQNARELLSAGAPVGNADLPAAFSAAARQRPDKLFLVVGQTLDSEVVAEMRRQAKAVGMIVNVIALGEHQKPLRQLAKATGGDYKVLDQKSLDTWATLIAQNGTFQKLEKEYLDR